MKAYVLQVQASILFRGRACCPKEPDNPVISSGGESWRQDLDPNCGLRSGFRSGGDGGKIFNGGYASSGEWPWMVRLRHYGLNPQTNQIGGNVY